MSVNVSVVLSPGVPFKEMAPRRRPESFGVNIENFDISSTNHETFFAEVRYIFLRNKTRDFTVNSDLGFLKTGFETANSFGLSSLLVTYFRKSG